MAARRPSPRPRRSRGRRRTRSCRACVRKDLPSRPAGARGIRFKINTEPGQKVPEGASVVNRKGLIATDVIVDGPAALIAAAGLSACGYTDNASLSRPLENFLEIIMKLKE